MGFIDSILNILRFNKRNWRPVVLCIFAATIFWFFNALNKTYTTNIRFPLAFDYNHENYLPLKPLPEEVRINVTGIGWNLFRRSSGIKVPPLTIPLDRPSEVKKIVGSTLPGFFSSQLDGLEINFVITDTIYLEFQPKARRWLKLGIDSIQKYIRRGYAIASELKIAPDSVFVEGPMSIITKIQEPANLRIPDRGIEEDYNQDVEVILTDGELIRRNPPTVTVSFAVERVLYRRDSIRLEIENFTSRSSPFFGVKKIQGTFAIRESMFNEFHADSIIAFIDLKGFKKGVIKVLPVVKGLPEYVKVVKIDSIRVAL